MKSFLTSLCLLLVVQMTSAQDCFLTVTSGGGFSGIATVYKIGWDGTVLKGKGLGQINYTEQSKLKKSAARKYYHKAKAIVVSSSDFNHPGNMYYSIGAHEKDKESKVTWGDMQHPAPEQVKSLYEELTGILTALTFKATTTK